MKIYIPFFFCFFFISHLSAQIIFEDDFDNGTFKGNWERIESIQGQNGTISISDNIGVGGSRGVLIGKLIDENVSTTNALDLYLDLSGQTNVELNFSIADYYDEDQEEDGIYFSDDGGGTFTKVVGFFPEEWCNVRMSEHPPVDVDRLAEEKGLVLNADFVIRFQQRGSKDFSGSSNNSSDGFALDEVKVYDPELVYESLPFADDFDLGVYAKAWTWNFADKTSTINAGSAITSPMNLVEVINDIGVGNSPAVAIGRICDGAFTTNAFDLHLNLLGETNVEMSFWIADYYDETEVDDGIYFSNDGGDTFTKVMGFFPSEWCNELLGEHPPIDVDRMAAAAGLALTDRFVIRFQQTGSRDFSGSSDNSEDGLVLDEVKVYDPGLVYETLPFEDDFNLGFYKKSWAWNFADSTSTINTGTAITSPMNLVKVVDNFGFENSPGVRIGRICDGSFTTNAFDLHLDLSAETNVEMSFWISDYYDETVVDEGIYFSNDGGDTFTKVMGFFPSQWCNWTIGQHPPLDVDRMAAAAGLAFTDRFVIRFQQNGNRDFLGGSDNSTDGFILDEVKVYDPGLTYAKLPFEDDFDLGEYNQSWAWNFADSTSTINAASAITSPMSAVEVVSNLGFENSPAVAIGRICDGSFTTNAFDLHLDLLGETNVEMTFWISDYYDETEADDGLYFSNDGGDSFVKVAGLFPDEWCNLALGQHPPLDIDRMAAAAGLALTDRFVVRFQQTGSRDFSGSSNASSDGFILDEVKVYDPALVYAMLPFEDDFDLGFYNQSWAWNFADSTSTINTGSAITSPMSTIKVVNDLGFENSPAVSMGRICDGPFTTNAFDLHLDLSAETNVEMTFWITDFYDETQVDDGLYFSNDGGDSFKKVLGLFPDEWCNLALGQHPPLDIDRMAAAAGLALTDRFVIRFQQTGGRDFSGSSDASSDGFILDEVKVYDPGLVYAPLPFEDDFELGVLGKSWAWNFADSTAITVSDDAITNPMSRIAISQDFPFDNSTFCVSVGKICDLTSTTNALDLHLDLLEEPIVKLSFWLADFYDENDLEDGVFLSNDGGDSFVQIFSFDFTNAANLVYQFYELDIASLADANGLELTDQCVIRFQQRGDRDFSGSSNNSSDGFYLDNVNVLRTPSAVKDFVAPNKLQIFPNPTDASFSIQLDQANSDIAYLEIYDFQGKRVYQNIAPEIAGEKKIRTDDLAPGIYLVLIGLEDGTKASGKLVKE